MLSDPLTNIILCYARIGFIERLNKVEHEKVDKLHIGKTAYRGSIDPNTHAFNVLLD